MFCLRLNPLVFGVLLALSNALFAAQPPQEGNFALPSSQQPGPLFSFGQYNIGQGQSQLFLYPNVVKGFKQNYSTVTMEYIVGLTDNLSYLINIPYATRYHESPFYSSGLSDIDLQMEYSVYSHTTAQYESQITWVGNLSIPAGSLNKTPPTGLGSPSLFLGATYSHTTIEWYWFLSPGITWVVPNHNNQLGSSLTYEAGIGRNLWSISSTSYGLLLVEFNGQYYNKDKINGILEPNTGGNVIYISPSLLFATQKLYTQLGIALPLTQHWNGDQPRVHYNASFLIGWTFN